MNQDYDPDTIKIHPKIIYNAIRCPDGTVLESKYRWDYVEHTQEDGRKYTVDGGHDYLRRGYSDKEYEELSVDTESPHKLIREVFTWTSSLDKDGNSIEPVTRALKDLEDDHVLALVGWTSEGYPEYTHKIMVDEAEFRGLDL